MGIMDRVRQGVRVRYWMAKIAYDRAFTARFGADYGKDEQEAEREASRLNSLYWQNKRKQNRGE